MAAINTIPASDPILLFPVRLETRFDTRADGKVTSLKIRIIPDEIQLQYTVDKMTRSDRKEGTRFWVRWFIASGDPEKEYDFWRQFCEKHGVNGAIRIATQTHPRNGQLDLFRQGGKYFTKRPYAYLDADDKLIDFTTVCQTIYDLLDQIHLSKSTVPDEKATKGITDLFKAVSATLATLSVALDGAPYVVDYLYTKVDECVSYLARRMESIRVFYEKHPGFKKDPGPFDLVDSDYFAFRRLYEQVADFREKLSRKSITLDEMIDKYLDNPDFKSSFFGEKVPGPNGVAEGDLYPAPTLPLLPDHFIVYGQGWGDRTKSFTISGEGKPIPPDLQMGFNLLAKEQGISVNNQNELVFPPEMKWMTDYNDALQKGMAITIPLGPFTDVSVYSLFVYGVKTKDYPKYALDNLFKSHLFWGETFSLVKTGTPTNLIDGARKVDEMSEEDVMESAYRMVVLDAGLQAPENSDGRKLTSLLGLDYVRSGLARATHTENMELDIARKANEVLWDWFEKKMAPNQPDDPKLQLVKHVRHFFLNFANGRGIAPAIRIDDQPYGIAAVSAFDRIQFKAHSYEDAYVKWIYEAIQEIGKKWQQLNNHDLVTTLGLKPGSDAHELFIQKMAQNPRSVQFDRRTFYYGPERAQTTTPEKLKALVPDDRGKAAPVYQNIVSFDIAELKTAVMKKLPSIEEWQAEYLVSEFMDAFTYRLDIWYTALLSFLMEKRKRDKVWAGSYGWVFNLHFKDDNKRDIRDEYILAPSIQHALTGAVLRSAYVQTKANANDTHMCINLSSMRARQGLRMIDGIKQGMSTGMILGADLERYLHEAYKQFKYSDGDDIQMDRCIYPLRKLFPLTIDIKAEDTRAEDYTLQVINGEALLNTFLAKWNNQGRLSEWLEQNWGDKSLTWLNDPEIGMRTRLNAEQLKVLFKLIERMADSYDALNDLLLAEGVHRLVAGDKASFGAIASFMSKGTANLPDPAVLQTPMDYAVIAHKVGLALPRHGKASAQSILATAEPSVNAWLATQMGPFENVVFFVDYTDGERRTFHMSNLREVGMQPLEYLHLSAYPKLLERMLELGWRKLDWNGRKHGTVRILTGDPAELEEGEILPEDNSVRLYEFSLLADDLAMLLARARSMRAGDIIPSVVGDSAEEEQMNTTELKGRYQTVFDALAKIHVQLEGFLNAPGHSIANPLTDVDIISIFELTGACARAGMYNEAPAFDPEFMLTGIDMIHERTRYDQAVEKQMKFLEQLQSFDEALQKRLAAAAAVVPPDDPEAETRRPAAYVEAIQTLTCKNLKVVTHFSVKRFREERPLRNQTFRSMGKDYKKVDNLTGNAFFDWMDEVAEVRPGMKLYHDIRMMRQLLGDASPQMNAGIFQVLSQGKIAFEWLGWTVSKEEILDDADSLVMFERQDFNEMLDNAGLIFDSWLEYIPFKKQTAGLTFHCDTPDAEAPQALLYAVHPELGDGKQWSPDLLKETLLSTETLFKLRMVDPETIYSDMYESRKGSLLSTDPILGKLNTNYLATYINKIME